MASLLWRASTCASSHTRVGVVTPLYTARCCHWRRTRVVDILDSEPQGMETNVKGWVKAIRKMKDVTFVDISDGSCSRVLQVVVSKTASSDSNIAVGTAIKADGLLDKNKNGQMEMKANNLVIVGSINHNDSYPFVPKAAHPPEYVRKYLHLRSHTDIFCSILRSRNTVTRAVHNYFHDEGFTEVNTPVLTSNDCEGAGEVFSVRPDSDILTASMIKPGLSVEEAYFDTKTYLSVSGQLHLEAMARGLGNVYTLGPTFRAENSRSRHHLSEFYMLEAEVAFMESTDDLLSFIEGVIKGIMDRVLKTCSDISRLQDKSRIAFLQKLIDKPFTVMTYDEAFDIVNKQSADFQCKAKWDQGFLKEHEMFLVAHSGGLPVFIIDWPEKIKPFYMKPSGDPSKVSAVDLLAPYVGELCGGSLREDDYHRLQEKLGRLGLEQSLSWYLELRKHGSIPSGGFGMGFERFLQLLLGVDNIKDTIPFPRWPHNCKL